MNTTVEVMIKQVYGRTLIYPINDTAKKLRSLIGTNKTIPENKLRLIKDLGFHIVFKQSEVIL